MQLNRQNYFSQEANSHYMSVSQYMDFIRCEAMAMAKLRGEYLQEDKDSFLMGKFLHAWNEGKLETFKKENPQLYKKNGNLYAKYRILESMIETLENDGLCRMALEGEKEVILTASLFNVNWKIIIDCYCPQKGRFSDLKGVKSLEERFYNKESGTYENFIQHYGYITQMAIYAAVEKEATHRNQYLEPYIVAVTKESPPNKAVISFDYESIKQELIKVESHLPSILEVKEGKREGKRCESCDYCRGTKKLTKVLHYTEL